MNVSNEFCSELDQLLHQDASTKGGGGTGSGWNCDELCTRLDSMLKRVPADELYSKLEGDVSKILPQLLLLSASSYHQVRLAVLPWLDVMKQIVCNNASLKNSSWWPALETKTIPKFCQLLFDIVENCHSGWAKPWCFAISVMCNNGYISGSSVNELLKVVEKAFKIGKKREWLLPLVFEVWRHLIYTFFDQNKNLHTKKVYSLIVTPLMSPMPTSSLYDKIKTWKYIVEKVKGNSPTAIETVLLPCVRFMYANKDASFSRYYPEECCEILCMMLKYENVYDSPCGREIVILFPTFMASKPSLAVVEKFWKAILDVMKSKNWDGDNAFKCLFQMSSNLNTVLKQDKEMGLVLLKYCSLSDRNDTETFELFRYENFISVVNTELIQKTDVRQIFVDLLKFTEFRIHVFEPLVNEMFSVAQSSEENRKHLRQNIMSGWDMLCEIVNRQLIQVGSVSGKMVEANKEPKDVSISVDSDDSFIRIVRLLLRFPIIHTDLSEPKWQDKIRRQWGVLLMHVNNSMSNEKWREIVTTLLSELFTGVSQSTIQPAVALDVCSSIMFHDKSHMTAKNILKFVNYIVAGFSTQDMTNQVMELLGVIDGLICSFGYTNELLTILNDLNKLLSSPANKEPSIWRWLTKLQRELLLAKNKEEREKKKKKSVYSTKEDTNPSPKVIFGKSNFLQRLGLAERNKKNLSCNDIMKMFNSIKTETLSDIPTTEDESYEKKKNKLKKSPEARKTVLEKEQEVNECSVGNSKGSVDGNFKPTSAGEIPVHEIENLGDQIVSETNPLVSVNTTETNFNGFKVQKQEEVPINSTPENVKKAEKNLKAMPVCSPSVKGKLSLSSRSPGQVSVNKKKAKKNLDPFSDSFDSQDFVVVPPKPKEDKPLTEHQKEMLFKRRGDIPALYQDLTQDTQSLQDSEAEVFNHAIGNKLPSENCDDEAMDLETVENIRAVICTERVQSSEKTVLEKEVPENSLLKTEMKMKKQEDAVSIIKDEVQIDDGKKKVITIEDNKKCENVDNKIEICKQDEDQSKEDKKRNKLSKEKVDMNYQIFSPQECFEAQDEEDFEVNMTKNKDSKEEKTNTKEINLNKTQETLNKNEQNKFSKIKTTTPKAEEVKKFQAKVFANETKNCSKDKDEQGTEGGKKEQEDEDCEIKFIINKAQECYKNYLCQKDSQEEAFKGNVKVENKISESAGERVNEEKKEVKNKPIVEKLENDEKCVEKSTEQSIGCCKNTNNRVDVDVGKGNEKKGTINETEVYVNSEGKHDKEEDNDKKKKKGVEKRTEENKGCSKNTNNSVDMDVGKGNEKKETINETEVNVSRKDKHDKEEGSDKKKKKGVKVVEDTNTGEKIKLQECIKDINGQGNVDTKKKTEAAIEEEEETRAKNESQKCAKTKDVGNSEGVKRKKVAVLDSKCKGESKAINKTPTEKKTPTLNLEASVRRSGRNSCNKYKDINVEAKVPKKTKLVEPEKAINSQKKEEEEESSNNFENNINEINKNHQESIIAKTPSPVLKRRRGKSLGGTGSTTVVSPKVLRSRRLSLQSQKAPIDNSKQANRHLKENETPNNENTCEEPSEEEGKNSTVTLNSVSALSVDRNIERPSERPSTHIGTDPEILTERESATDKDGSPTPIRKLGVKRKLSSIMMEEKDCDKTTLDKMSEIQLKKRKSGKRMAVDSCKVPKYNLEQWLSTGKTACGDIKQEEVDVLDKSSIEESKGDKNADDSDEIICNSQDELVLLTPVSSACLSLTLNMRTSPHNLGKTGNGEIISSPQKVFLVKLNQKDIKRKEGEELHSSHVNDAVTCAELNSQISNTPPPPINEDDKKNTSSVEHKTNESQRLTSNVDNNVKIDCIVPTESLASPDVKKAPIKVSLVVLTTSLDHNDENITTPCTSPKNPIISQIESTYNNMTCADSSSDNLKGKPLSDISPITKGPEVNCPPTRKCLILAIPDKLDTSPISTKASTESSPDNIRLFEDISPDKCNVYPDSGETMSFMRQEKTRIRKGTPCRLGSGKGSGSMGGRGAHMLQLAVASRSGSAGPKLGSGDRDKTDRLPKVRHSTPRRRGRSRKLVLVEKLSTDNWPSGECEEWVACVPTSPGINPATSILKRKMNTATEETPTPDISSPATSPPTKKKRVSFLDPPVSKGLLYNTDGGSQGQLQHALLSPCKVESMKVPELEKVDKSKPPIDDSVLQTNCTVEVVSMKMELEGDMEGIEKLSEVDVDPQDDSVVLQTNYTEEDVSMKMELEGDIEGIEKLSEVDVDPQPEVTSSLETCLSKDQDVIYSQDYSVDKLIKIGPPSLDETDVRQQMSSLNVKTIGDDCSLSSASVEKVGGVVTLDKALQEIEHVQIEENVISSSDKTGLKENFDKEGEKNSSKTGTAGHPIETQTIQLVDELKDKTKHNSQQLDEKMESEEDKFEYIPVSKELDGDDSADTAITLELISDAEVSPEKEITSFVDSSCQTVGATSSADSESDKLDLLRADLPSLVNDERFIKCLAEHIDIAFVSALCSEMHKRRTSC